MRRRRRDARTSCLAAAVAHLHVEAEPQLPLVLVPPVGHLQRGVPCAGHLLGPGLASSPPPKITEHLAAKWAGEGP